MSLTDRLCLCLSGHACIVILYQGDEAWVPVVANYTLALRLAEQRGLLSMSASELASNPVCCHDPCVMEECHPLEKPKCTLGNGQRKTELHGLKGSARDREKIGLRPMQSFCHLIA